VKLLQVYLKYIAFKDGYCTEILLSLLIVILKHILVLISMCIVQ